jgi:hypothetical protein
LNAYTYLAGCADAAWEKGKKYYYLAETESPAYYATIILNPTLKTTWFDHYWGDHNIKREYIPIAKDFVKKY